MTSYREEAQNQMRLRKVLDDLANLLPPPQGADSTEQPNDNRNSYDTFQMPDWMATKLIWDESYTILAHSSVTLFRFRDFIIDTHALPIDQHRHWLYPQSLHCIQTQSINHVFRLRHKQGSTPIAASVSLNKNMIAI